MPKTLTPKPPTLVAIPAGTPAAKCKRCPETIWFVGKQPLRVAAVCKSRSTGRAYETPTAKEPSATEDGVGFSHFIDCIESPFFQRKR